MDPRNRYLGTVNSDDQAHPKDIIQEETEEIAYQKGIYDLLQTSAAHPLDEDTLDEDTLTAEQREPLDFYRTATGKFFPLRVVVLSWLDQVPNKVTRENYKTTLNNLSQHFAVAEEITHQRAAAFLESAPTHYNVSKATVGKWQSGFINLWKYLKKDYSVWKNYSILSAPDKMKSRGI